MPKFSVENGVVDYEEVLSQIPSNATRVKIQNHSGQEKWRNPKEFEHGDKVIIQNGEAKFMYGKPGRKSRKEEEDEISPIPTTAEAEEAALQRRKFMERDSLLSGIYEDPTSDEVLDSVLEALAEEQSSLAFERKSQEARNAPISQISLRRVNALKTMGELWFKRKEQLSTKEIDLNSEEFAKLLSFLIETFIEAMSKSQIEPDSIEVVKVTLVNLIQKDTWVATAKKRMKD